MKKFIIPISIVIIGCIALFIKNMTGDISIKEYETNTKYVYLLNNNTNRTKNVTIKMSNGVYKECKNLCSKAKDIIIIDKNNQDQLFDYTMNESNNDNIIEFNDYDDNIENNFNDYGSITIDLKKNKLDNKTYQGVISILLFDKNNQLIDIIQENVELNDSGIHYKHDIDGTVIEKSQVMYRFWSEKGS